jgi:nitrite reductase (NADH) small subunit
MDKVVTVKLGPLDQIAVGHGLCFIVGGQEIAVFRSRKNELFAIENRCPHRQGPLAEGITGDGKVVCPLHGHKFDLATGQGSEGQECVKTFKVWNKDGELFMECPLDKVSSKYVNA